MAYEGLGDWPVLRVNGKTRERLRQVIDLVDGDHAVGYVIDKSGQRLVFFKYATKSMLPLPFKMDKGGMTDFAWNWLRQVEYPVEPDHDGHNGAGWIVYVEAWGHVEPYHYESLVAIEPEWMMYGK